MSQEHGESDKNTSTPFAAFRGVFIVQFTETFVQESESVCRLLNITHICAKVVFEELESSPPRASLTLFHDARFALSSQTLTNLATKPDKEKKSAVASGPSKYIIHAILSASLENMDASTDVNVFLVYRSPESRESKMDRDGQARTLVRTRLNETGKKS